MTAPSHIEVVVPARNEERHISACLMSIHRAMAQLTAEHREMSCGVTVVLDCCTDSTAERAAELRARVVVSTLGRVGAARGAGAADAVGRSRSALLPDHLLWLANTDADSVVPSNWLTTQVRFAAAGHDAVIGTVTPDGLDPEVDRRWKERHILTEGTPMCTARISACARARSWRRAASPTPPFTRTATWLTA